MINEKNCIRILQRKMRNTLFCKRKKEKKKESEYTFKLLEFVYVHLFFVKFFTFTIEGWIFIISEASKYIWINYFFEVIHLAQLGNHFVAPMLSLVDDNN